MIVLHVLPSASLDRGGPSRSVPQLCDALRSVGVDARLAAGGPSEQVDIPLRHIPIRGELLTPTSARQLHQAIQRSALVEIHSFWNLTTTLAAQLARVAGRPYVLTPRGMLTPHCTHNSRLLKVAAHALYDNRTIRAAAGFHFMTEDERRDSLFIPGALRDNSVVAGNGVPAPPATELGWEGLPDLGGAPFLLSLGRLDPIKRLDLQIEAIHALPLAPKPRLVIAGPDFGIKGRLQSLVRQRSLQSVVHFVGPVNGEARFQLLKAASAVLITSEYDCCPVVSREALSVGAALVAVKGAGVDDLAKRGAAILADPTPGALAKALTELLTQPSRSLRLREQAQEAARDLAWEPTARALAAYYASVVANHARNHARDGGRGR